MNSSAKILFTLVAAGALGAVAIACTVSSGTVDDVDGGSSSGNNTSSSGSTTSSSGTTTDGGSTTSSSGATDQCPAAKTDINQNDTADCKTCLRTSCCAQITAYEDKAADDSGGLLGTDGYAKQLSDCDDDPDPNGCKGITKKNPPTQDGVPAIYDNYLSCRTTSCTTQCQGVAEADAGSQ